MLSDKSIGTEAWYIKALEAPPVSQMIDFINSSDSDIKYVLNRKEYWAPKDINGLYLDHLERAGILKSVAQGDDYSLYENLYASETLGLTSETCSGLSSNVKRISFTKFIVQMAHEPNSVACEVKSP